MALKDLMSLFDSKLKDVFHVQAYDATKDREKLIKRLEATKEKFLQTEPPRGRKDFDVRNNVVEWTPPTPSGGTLFEDGTVYIPAERYAEAIDRTIQLVRDKAFDARLESAGTTGDAPAAPKTRKPRQARPEGSSGKREWTPERKAKFQATIAARNAAKG